MSFFPAIVPLQEVEKEVEEEGGGSGTGRGSKGRKRTVTEMQYEYDASMEGRVAAAPASLLPLRWPYVV